MNPFDFILAGRSTPATNDLDAIVNLLLGDMATNWAAGAYTCGPYGEALRLLNIAYPNTEGLKYFEREYRGAIIKEQQRH